MKTFITLILLLMIFSPIIHAQNKQDDYLFMIEHAIKAPSGHNTQPWLFKINDSSIEIHPNYDKCLAVVDKNNRELFISLGCALENLCIAASIKGYKQNINIDEKGIITVHLSYPDISAKYNSLFLQIPHKQTNRNMYNGRKITTDTLALLEKTKKEKNINFYFYENGSAEFDTLCYFVEQGNQIQMRDKTFKKELKEWMRFNKKQSIKTKDGLSYDVFGAPNLPLFISKPAISLVLNEKTQVKNDKRKIASSSHLVLFTIENDNIQNWIDLGRTLQRFLLLATEFNMAHSYFNQPNEIEDLSIKMSEVLKLSKEYPAILLRIGYSEKMPYSKRKDIQDVIME